MFVKRLYIKNYRCFDDTASVVEFSDSGLTALIGPNNVGKSTALKALEILLGDKWPSGQFNSDDFHHNNTNIPIVIACEFTHPISVEIYGSVKDVRGAVVTATHLETGFGQSSVNIDFSLIEDPGDFENGDWSLTEYKGYTAKVSQQIKNMLPVVITVPLIKLQSEQPTNKWGVLGRMLQKVERDFIEHGDSESRFIEKIAESVSILREPAAFGQIENSIKEFWEEMRPSNLSGTTLEFLDFEPWHYYRQFKLAIRRETKPVPIDTLGEGVQRLAIIALYRTYLKHHARNERAILLIEEPESYLHPQARTTLFSVLEKAIKNSANTEGQIIFTTHSENFIDCGAFNDIVIFRNDENYPKARHVSTEIMRKHTEALGYLSTISNQHLFFRFLETQSQGLKEALFAQKAVIVEGPTEIELFRHFTDADNEQIAIVCVNGKNSITAAYNFLTAFGIPCLVVIDRDAEKSSSSDNIRVAQILSQSATTNPDSTKMQIIADDINAVPGNEMRVMGRLLVFSPDLESYMKSIVPKYTEIIEEVKIAFHQTESKPRNMQGLGLAYKGEFGDNLNLEKLITEAKTELNSLSSNLSEFIKTECDIPQLLEPTPPKDSSPVIVEASF